MSVIPEGDWYPRLIKMVEEQHVGVADLFGRPWAEHFQRVALRIYFRNPQASQAVLEAAMLHDALMARGGGYEYLAKLKLGDDAIRIIELVTPPPNADYYRDLSQTSDDDVADYLDFIRRLCSSGNTEAIELKLADINDTMDQLLQFNHPAFLVQMNRYQQSWDLMTEALASQKAQ